MPDLTGKVVVLTGAARGLGREVAQALLDNGASLCAVDLPNAQSLLDELVDSHGSDRVLKVEADVTSEADCKRTIKATLDAFGHVDALINNAGLGPDFYNKPFLTDPKPFHTVSLDQWRAVYEVNTIAPILLTDAVVHHMIERGSGRIINVVTSRPTYTTTGMGPYAGSKAALETMTRIWAEDLRGTGVTANALMPGGPSNTRMVPDISRPDRDALFPSDVMAGPAVWLCSDLSADMTGYRLNGSLWDRNAPLDEAVRAASGPAGYA